MLIIKMNDTRIKKYASLRNKIEQEIKILQLRVKNDAKLNHYANKLNKINASFFQNAQEKVNENFPDLKSLVQTTKTVKSNDLKTEKINVDTWLEKINQNLFSAHEKTRNIADYVPNLDGEEQLLNQIQQWKKNQFYQKKDFAKMLRIKKEIMESQKKLPKKDISKINIFADINRINNQIQSYNQKLKNLIDEKKSKTKWLFLLGLFLFLGIVLCLVLIFYFF